PSYPLPLKGARRNFQNRARVSRNTLSDALKRAGSSIIRKWPVPSKVSDVQSGTISLVASTLGKFELPAQTDMAGAMIFASDWFSGAIIAAIAPSAVAGAVPSIVARI